MKLKNYYRGTDIANPSGKKKGTHFWNAVIIGPLDDDDDDDEMILSLPTSVQNQCLPHQIPKLLMATKKQGWLKIEYMILCRFDSIRYQNEEEDESKVFFFLLIVSSF